MDFTLDARLAEDTHPLGEVDDNLLLLSKNALFPWFILVPKTQETEFHKLNSEQQANIQQHINAVARFIEKHFSSDKINIATIGNIVSQLHVHIIGRKESDVCWPGVVWGTSHFKNYESQEITAIKKQWVNSLPKNFHPSDDHQ